MTNLWGFTIFKIWSFFASLAVTKVLLRCYLVPTKVKVIVTQLCLTLCDPMDCSPPRSCVPATLQARILEWVDTPFSRGSSPPKDWTQVSYVARGFFTIWATREVHFAPMHLSQFGSFLSVWLARFIPIVSQHQVQVSLSPSTLLTLPGVGWGFFMRACSTTAVVAVSDYHTASPLLRSSEQWAPIAQGLSFPSLSPWQRT